MSRKKFIESNGATCANWTWSWSFVNDDQRYVIFGAWDIHMEGENALILSTDWEYNKNGHKQAAYNQAVEHLRLVEDQGYDLKIFKMTYSTENKDDSGYGPAKIDGFEPVLIDRVLRKSGNNWYAETTDSVPRIAEEIETPEKYIEGASKQVSINTYERNARARDKCIQHHGYKCSVCEFSFEDMYGDMGVNYIHVHHIIPVSELKQEYELDPVKDLAPVCPNCHSIIHRFKPALSIKELKEQIRRVEKST